MERFRDPRAFRRNDDGESGSALLIALITVALIGLVVAALGTWGSASVHVDRTASGVRDAQYGADGALQGALNLYKSGVSCSPADSQPHPFFSYSASVVQPGGPSQQVNYSVTCAQDAVASVGASPTPPSDLCPMTASGSDFAPVNNSHTSSTLSQSLRFMEQPASGNLAGNIADTHYAKVGNNSVAMTNYYPCGAACLAAGTCTASDFVLPGGASLQNVELRVSHSETTNGSSQTQSVKVVTGTCPSGTTYTVGVAKPTGGPSWPSPAYQTIDVSACITTASDLQNATVTYQAQAPCAPSSCGNAADQLDGAVLAVRLKSTPTASPSVRTSKPNDDFFTKYGNCANDYNNWGTREVSWSNSTNCATPPSAGVSAEPTCSGSQVSSCSTSSNTRPAHASNAQFCGTSCATGQGAAVGDSHSITFSGFNWPTDSPIQSAYLRVVHVEPWVNFEPSVTITVTGLGSCTLNKSSSPALTSSGSALGSGANTTFKQDVLVLPTQCAPVTQAELTATTLTYTIACASAGGQGGTKCGTGGTSSPTNYLDAVMFDYNYLSGTGPVSGGGAGNTNPVSFVANVGAAKKGSATYDPANSSVGSWNVRG